MRVSAAERLWESMTVAETAASIRAAQRLQSYRNSVPRQVKLLGIGEGGLEIVKRIAQAGLPNVMPVPLSDGAQLAPLDAPVAGRRPNIIVLVYRSGDPAVIPAVIERPAPLVSFVLLEPLGQASQGKSETVRRLRAIADVFVTTSDDDFVFDLVGNLAS
jgi:hypothetical protein